jgi:Subtilase family
MRDGVRIADDGLAAQWAAWRTVLARRTAPFAALHDGERPRLLFVEDELLVNPDDERTMALLRGRDDVVMEPPREVPPAPEGMDPDKARPLDGMPRIAKVRFDGRRLDEKPLLERVRETALRERDLSVTSQAGLGTLSLAAELAREGARVMPNAVGQPVGLPRGASAEDAAAPGGPDAYGWQEFARHGFPRAWQLVDAFRQLRTTAAPTTDVGILDAGFWLENGMPGAPPGRPPEFPAPVLQWNLSAEGQHAGGWSATGGAAWHGQFTASLCVAPHDDGAGVAGAGGTIARPFLFKSIFTSEEVIRGVQLATAWGLDVMNMSFVIPESEISDESDFNDIFQWGADNGLVIVAAAGNHGRRLPDLDLRPATRTPGVITVGALDGDVAWPCSNYGVSVDLWAQGVDAHVGPTPATSEVTLQSGTSMAAPIVAGAVAMMKYVDYTLKTPAILKVLQDTARRGSPDPKVTATLDAAAAVWEVMGRRLPSDLAESDDASSGARPLTPDPAGGPDSVLIGARAISRVGDVDWHVFSLDDFTLLTVDLAYAAGLGSAFVTLVPDDPGSRAAEDLGETRTRGRHHLGPALVAPGTYRLKVTGAVTLYELRARVARAPLQPDGFEANDTLAQATLFTLHTASDKRPWVTLAHRRGTYELSLDRPSDVDFLHVTDVPAAAIMEPIVAISRTDAPVDVALVRADGAVQAQWNGVRTQRVVLPEGEARLRISARSPTRYSLYLNVEADPSKVPGPWRKVPLSPFPDWWPDPPWKLHGWEQYLQVVLDPEVVRTPGLRLSGHAGLTLDLLAQDGTPVGAAVRIGDGELHLPLTDVQPGTYVVRIGRDLDAAARLAPGALPPALFSLGPVL